MTTIITTTTTHAIVPQFAAVCAWIAARPGVDATTLPAPECIPTSVQQDTWIGLLLWVLRDETWGMRQYATNPKAMNPSINALARYRAGEPALMGSHRIELLRRLDSSTGFTPVRPPSPRDSAAIGGVIAAVWAPDPHTTQNYVDSALTRAVDAHSAAGKDRDALCEELVRLIP